MSNYTSTIDFATTEPVSSNNFDDVYPGLDCILTDSSEEMYAIIGIYCFLCLIPTVISLHAIFGHYCSSKQDLMSEIRFWSILSTVSFLIFDYDAVIDVYFAMKCDLSPNSYLSKYDEYGSTFITIGFYSLYFLFILKLKHGFKDSLFDVSKTYIISLTMFGIIGFICSIIAYILSILTFENSSLALLSIGIIFYVCGNILLSKTMVSTLYAFIKFKNRDKTVLNKNGEMFQAFVRLIVVYTCSISSTVITLAILMTTSFILSENVILFNQWAMWYRALLIGDHIINICCLLFQNASAFTFYTKSCCLCHSCVMKMVQRHINNHINDKHLTITITTTIASEKVEI